MRVLRMRQKLQAHGFTMEQKQQGFVVEGGTLKEPFEQTFKNLDEVQRWFSEFCQAANRLTEEECKEWDEEFKVFVLKQNQCDGCRRGLPVVEGNHMDERGFVVMGCSKNRYER